MKQLIRLNQVSLYKLQTEQLPDGDYKDTLTLTNHYKVIIEELTDEISTELYGADINRMIRVSSVNKSLEKFLYTKLNNTSDNVSKYEIEFGNNMYEIKNVRSSYIDCKRL